MDYDLPHDGSDKFLDGSDKFLLIFLATIAITGIMFLFFLNRKTPKECMSITRNQYLSGEGSMACEEYLNKTYNN